jgi:hypothetical protein
MKLGLEIANPQITNCKRDCVSKSANCNICERSANLTSSKVCLLICDLGNLFVDLWYLLFIHLGYIVTKSTSHSAYKLLSYSYKLYLKRSRDKSFKETLLSKKIKFKTCTAECICKNPFCMNFNEDYYKLFLSVVLGSMTLSRTFFC